MKIKKKNEYFLEDKFSKILLILLDFISKKVFGSNNFYFFNYGATRYARIRTIGGFLSYLIFLVNSY